MKSPDELRAIAAAIIDLGYGRAEAVPVTTWRKRGWPEDDATLRVIDGYIRVLKYEQAYSGSLLI